MSTNAIFKGDDTGALGNKFITIKLKNPELYPISKLKFVVNGGCCIAPKEFTDEETHFQQEEIELVVNFSSEETSKLNATNTGNLVGYDMENRQFTCPQTLTFTEEWSFMQMPELAVDFIISNNRHFDCSFEIFAAGTTWGSIDGNIESQTDLIGRLNQKVDTSTVEDLTETVQDNYNTLDNKIDTHIADKTNPHEVTKEQVGLGNVDNTSDLNKPISTATQAALNDKQNTISDLSTIRTNSSNGQSAYNTIQNYGDIVTYDASYFATSEQGQKADTALQPNDDISELNNDVGYITSASLPTVNNSTITIQRNNIRAGDFNLNQANNETININVPTTASDIDALPDTTTIEDLTTTAQQNAINSGATTSNIGQIATNTSNINSLSNTVTSNYNTLNGRITSEVSTLNTSIGTETTNRQNADNNLQSQIDAIVSSSDVFDIVGTYAELQDYDISTVPVNDIIKVLVNSTHSNAATYYRCVESGGVKSWSYIGSEGAYYTKSESDNLFVEQTTTVNNKPLSTNITLTASDVGALPSSTIIGDGTLTIQKNGVNVDTFSANATSNKTINLTTTSSDVVDALGYTPYDASNPEGYTSNVGTITDVQMNGTSIVTGSVADITKITPYTSFIVPDTTDMPVIATYEFDIASVDYYKVCSIANNYTRMSDIKGFAIFRMTVTGVDINQKIEGIIQQRQTNEPPYLYIRNYRGSASVATTGIRFFRICYPKALNNGYNWDIELAAYNDTARHIKVEIIKTEPQFTWINSLTPSTYDSTYQSTLSLTAYTNEGICGTSTLYFNASSASSAGYISSYLPKIVGGTQPTAGAALLANQFAFMNANKVYPASNKTTAIEPGYGLTINTTAYTANATVAYTSPREKGRISSLTNIPHATLAKGNPCYFRCTMDSSGNIHSDNYVATSMAAGYTWYYVGIAGSASEICVNTTNSLFLTLDSSGKLTHINGKALKAAISSSDVITALGYTPYNSTNPNGYTSNVGTVTSVNNTQPDANGNVTISVTGGANTDLSNLTTTGEAHFQEPLVSGTNIKTVNNTSLLGSGNIDISGLFVATYGTTTFAEITGALSQNKAIICKNSNNYYSYVNAANNSYYFTYTTGGGYIFQVSVSSSDVWGTSATYMAETTSNKTSTISSSSTDTQYPSAKSVIDLLKTIYPVGCVYLTTNSTCPLSALFGTWSLVSSGRALWTGTGSNGNTTIAAGLPNINGTLCALQHDSYYTGAFTQTAMSGSYQGASSGRGPVKATFSASGLNTIYGNATTVQPPAYVVNVFRRTA